jgi:parvulin-like peptidyl-prolyl isomerase
VGAKSGQSRKSGRQRLALAIFAAVFVLLFIGFAVAEGIGQPSIPSGAIAIVKGVPSEDGTVTETDFKRALLQQVAQGKLKKTPKPGEKKYEELKTAAMGEIFDAIWISGEAEELGIEVSPKQIATELAAIKKQNFKTEAEFQKFLATSHFTKADVVKRVKLQLLSTQIQEVIAKKAPPATESEIASYYDSVKDTQYTTPATRDVRIVVSKNKADVEKAKAALDQDDSPANWKKVAAKYSEDPTTKTKGGLQPGLSEELLKGKGSIEKAIFGSPTGEVSDLVDYEKNFFVVEVEKLNPAKVQKLPEVEAQIKSQLTQTVAQAVFSEFVSDYQSKWQSRTYCASDFVTERCSNYVGSGHPASAPATCYEADPKGGTPKECPASVTQTTPAIPGTTNLLKPQGERLVQRPQPEGLKPASAASALTEAAAGATPGATEAPTTGAAPTGE